MESIYREMLNQKRLSISDKNYIEQEYNRVFGRQLKINTDCRNCYNDALTELYHACKKFQLKAGQVDEIEGIFYNRHTLPK